MPINEQMVASQGDSIIILRPKARMTKSEALHLAAWIVALADEGEESGEFEKILDSVMSI